MARTGIHKTTHLHRMAFVGEANYDTGNTREYIPTDAKIAKGCRVAAAVLRATEDPEEQDFLNGMITPALLGSAWRDAFIEDIRDLPNDLMYRTVELPRLDIDRDIENIANAAWQVGIQHVQAAAEDRPFAYNRLSLDGKLMSIHRTRRPYRSLAAASLWLGAIDAGRQVDNGWLHSPESVQAQVRESGYRMTRRTLQLAHKIGFLPTIGQLDDAYSPLTVEFMRRGPRHLRDTYQESFEVSPSVASSL